MTKRPEGRFRLGWIERVALAVIAALVLCLPVARSVPAQDGQTPLVVIVLVDGSESMTRTDPAQFRETAAIFLVDFLAANGETLELNYRLGAASFDEAIIDSFPPTLVSDVDMTLIRVTTPDPTRGTDFGPALDHAIRELRPRVSEGEQLAVVLFTDGRPIQDGAVVSNPDGYFRGLGQQVEELEEMGAAVFVAGIGDALEDRDRWERVLAEGNFRSITDPSELYEVYSSWFSELIGLETVGDAERLEGGSSETFTVEPFLEQVFVTAIKDDPAAEFVLRDPNGDVVAPSGGGREGDRHVVYSEGSPLHGKWEVSVANGGANYYVWQRQPTATLSATPLQPAIDGSLTVEMRDLSNRLETAGEELQVFLEIRKGGLVVGPSVELARQDGDFYRYSFGTLEDVLPGIGAYEFAVTARVADEPVTILVEPLLLEVFERPSIALVWVDGVQQHEDKPILVEPGQELLVEVEVTHPDLLGATSRLTYDLSTTDEIEFIGAAELTADGNQLYTARIVVPEEAVGGQLVIRLDGGSTLGVGLNDDWVTGLWAAATPEPVGPVITATPTETPVTPTVLPEPTLGQMESPGPRPKISDILGPLWLIIVMVGTLVVVGVLLKINSRYFRYPDPRTLDEIESDEQFDVEFSTYIQRAVSYKGNVGQRIEKGFESALSSFTKHYALEDNPKNDSERFFLKLVAQTKIIEDEELLLAMAKFLNARRWSKVTAPTVISDVYDKLIKYGQPKRGIIKAVARAIEIDTKPSDIDRLNIAHLFSALAQAMDDPNAVEFSNVAEFSHSSADCSGRAFSALYDLLKQLDKSVDFGSQLPQLDETIGLLNVDETGPLILLEFLNKVRTKLSATGQTGSVEELKRYTEGLLAAQQVVAEYKHLPEAIFLSGYIRTFIEIAEKRSELLNGDINAISPGVARVEIRPSLDVFEVEEQCKWQSKDVVWEKIKVPLAFYHIGNTLIEALEITAELNGSRRSELDNKESLAVGGTKALLFDLTDKVSERLSVKIIVEYKREIVPTDVHSYQPQSQKTLLPIQWVGEQPKKPIVAEALNSPFVFGRPLKAKDLENMGINLSMPGEIKEWLENSTEAVKLVSITGLRSSGKTTNLHAFYKLLRDRVEDDLPRCLLLEINLMTLWRAFPDPEAVNADDVAPIFWKQLSTVVKKELGELNIALDPIASELVATDILFDDPEVPINVKIAEIVKALVELQRRSGLQIVLTVDDADLLANFNHPATFYALAKLSHEALTWVIVCHDEKTADWLIQLKKAFQSLSDEGEESQESGWYKPFVTGLAGREKTIELLKTGGILHFSNLAEEAVWTFTGGYFGLIQLLCDVLVEDLKRAAESNGGQVAPLISIHHVKDVVYRYSIEFPELLDYLRFSFTPDERWLMMLLARDYVEASTGVLRHLKIEGGWKPEGITKLHKDLNQFGRNMDRNAVISALNHILSMNVLEKLGDEDGIYYVRWRIGWLQAYFKFLSYEILAKSM